MSRQPPPHSSPGARWVVLALVWAIIGALGVAGRVWFPLVFSELGWWILWLAASLGLLAAFLPPFGRRAADPRLDNLTRQLLRIREVKRLVRLITSALVRYFGATHATIYLEGAEATAYWMVSSHGPDRPTAMQHLKTASLLVRWLLQHRQPLRRERYPRPPSHPDARWPADPYARLYLVLENLKSQVVVPSFRGGRLLGFVILGPRANGQPYDDAEIALLARLARDCAVALENAGSYDAWKTTAQKLQSAKDRLLRQERMVAASRLAMGLAHEIKNPLAAIKTFTEQLSKRHHDPAFLQEYLRVMSMELDRIDSTAQSLRDFGKPILLRVQTMDIQKLLRDMVTLLSNECLKHDIALQQDLEPAPIFLPGDPSQLKQVFVNLCINAMEAMPHGGTLSVSCRFEHGEAVIRIADTGTGIAQEHLAQLFDPFFTTKDTGMGLGLAVVKQVVDQHAGSTRVESEAGAGSSFEVRLPLAVRLKPRQPEEEPVPVSANGSIHPHTKGFGVGVKPISGPPDILVVDDEPDIREMVKICCEALGCQVRAVESGEEAAKAISQRPPHLVLLDLTLYALNGFEVLKRVKMTYPAVPMAVITGSADPDVDERVRELGAIDCLHKPMNIPTLKQRISELIARISAPAAAAPPETTRKA